MGCNSSYLIPTVGAWHLPCIGPYMLRSAAVRSSRSLCYPLLPLSWWVWPLFNWTLLRFWLRSLPGYPRFPLWIYPLPSLGPSVCPGTPSGYNPVSGRSAGFSAECRSVSCRGMCIFRVWRWRLRSVWWDWWRCIHPLPDRIQVDVIACYSSNSCTVPKLGNSHPSALSSWWRVSWIILIFDILIYWRLPYILRGWIHSFPSRALVLRRWFTLSCPSTFSHLYCFCIYG